MASLREKFILKYGRNKTGFTLIEMIVYVAIVAIIVSAIAVFAVWLIQSGAKAKLSRALMENGRQAMDTIVYEIKKSRNVYAPTSVFDANPGQLSLVQTATSTPGETETYIDIFQCGSAVCLKREGASPINLTNGQIKITSLVFSQLLNSATAPSLQISLRLENNFSSDRPEYQEFLELTTAANLRSY